MVQIRMFSSPAAARKGDNLWRPVARPAKLREQQARSPEDLIVGEFVTVRIMIQSTTKASSEHRVLSTDLLGEELPQAVEPWPDHAAPREQLDFLRIDLDEDATADGALAGVVHDGSIIGSTSLPGSPLSYVGIFKAEPLERVGMIKAGMPASEAKRVLSIWPSARRSPCARWGSRRRR